MDTVTKDELETPVGVERKRAAYDPNNLHAAEEEARRYDDTYEGIDWDEILATTQDDFLAGRFSYNSADYATQAEADAALTAWLDAIVEEVEREAGSISSRDAPG